MYEYTYKCMFLPLQIILVYIYLKEIVEVCFYFGKAVLGGELGCGGMSKDGNLLTYVDILIIVRSV